VREVLGYRVFPPDACVRVAFLLHSSPEGILTMGMFSPLRRVVRSLRRAGAPSTRNSPPALGFERLEDRWVPAVNLAGITGLGTNTVAITDTATGNTANAIAIIDDLSTRTTYIKINGGAEAQLGATGTILSNLSVHMGAGNDRVSFYARGSGPNSVMGSFSTRSIYLEGGDDTATVDWKLAAGSTSTVNSFFRNNGYSYLRIDGGTGNDTIQVDLGTFGGSSMDFYVSLYAGTGADKVTLDGDLPNGATNRLEVYAHLGNDADKDVLRSTLDAGQVSALDRLRLYYDDSSKSDELTFKKSSVSALWTLY
jgi:hypothetical protein